MAFKTSGKSGGAVGTPEELFRDLRNRKVEGLLAHQADILREYAQSSIESPDVALQLPTGSGKTLVGLLLAEWRRRKLGQRVAYLCPTNQLVNQVLEQSREYGIKTIAFVGKRAEYAAGPKGDYLGAEVVALTSYSALFNTNPFFDSAQTLVLDDSHAAENYVGKYWSLLIRRRDHEPLYKQLVGALKAVLSPSDYMRLVDAEGAHDGGWVDKLPTPVLRDLSPMLTAILDVGTKSTELSFGWSVLRDHLLGCHFYLSQDALLVRPLIPPTWHHKAFVQPAQRIYMSATLGEGGDLERLWGRTSIKRLGVPPGWDKQGIGRRLFFFPERALSEAKTRELVANMIKSTDRAMILVPDDRTEEDFAKWVGKETSYKTFDATQLEKSKKPFVTAKGAVAVVANRYDGVDLVGDECRLLVVSGLPQSRNLQERFLIAKVGAGSMLQDRVLTRVTQAVGRCTRSATDYAAVVIMGQDLNKFLLQSENRRFFHPEIQAELTFGIDQSKDTTADNFLDNLRIFFEHGDEWDGVDRLIVESRFAMSQHALPEATKLAVAVPDEIAYQTAIWNGDYIGALEAAKRVLSHLSGDVLMGYRSFWDYLAGAAASLAGREPIARDYYRRAADISITLRWLRGLSEVAGEGVQKQRDDDTAFGAVIEGLEAEIERVGNVTAKRFEAEAKAIIDGLSKNDAKSFEIAQEKLGKLMGYRSGRSANDAAPDPWWCAGDELCVVFEDHTNVEEQNTKAPLGANKVRQAAGHPNWIRENVALSSNAEILPVIVTPCSTISSGAAPHVGQLCYWSMDDFRRWAGEAITVVRRVWTKFPGPGDLAWRAEATQAYKEAGLDPATLMATLRSSPLGGVPVVSAQ